MYSPKQTYISTRKKAAEWLFYSCIFDDRCKDKFGLGEISPSITKFCPEGHHENPFTESGFCCITGFCANVTKGKHETLVNLSRNCSLFIMLSFSAEQKSKDEKYITLHNMILYHHVKTQNIGTHQKKQFVIYVAGPAIGILNQLSMALKMDGIVQKKAMKPWQTDVNYCIMYCKHIQT